MEPITIRMLGSFTLEAGGVVLCDTANRSRKVWMLLAYLLSSREPFLPQKKLIDMLWGNDSSNPENALRITLHRLRTLLDQLWPGAGRELILYSEGGYGWNREARVTLDCERFETLSAGEEPEEEARLAAYLEGLSWYGGEFLPKYSGEFWVIPKAAHFHNRFLETSMAAAELLGRRSRYDEAIALCLRAVESEPYHEPLHQLLMTLLGRKGDPKGAAGIYETLRQRLFDDFGIQPTEETKAVYRTWAHSPEDRTLPIDEVLAYLQEPPTAWAMICDYDYFKVLCFAESRSMERSGNVTHIALFSLASPDREPLSRRSLDRTMDLLEGVLKRNLRRGDTIARCSVSQFIIMLPMANYENSCMVCRRLLAAFQQAHPRTAVKIHYLVQPLTPSVSIP